MSWLVFLCTAAVDASTGAATLESAPPSPSSWLDAVFNPAWNLQNQPTIYAAVVIALFLAGVGLPLPEDIPLTITGFTTTMQGGGEFQLWRFIVAFAMVTVPIIGGDLIAYTMGKRWGLGLRERFRFTRALLTDARVARARGWFQRRGNFAVFLGRQVAGVRFATFFTAGTLEMPLRTFILFDFLGCLVSVPVWLTLGFLGARFGRPWLDRATTNVGLAFLIGAVAIALVYFVGRWLRRGRTAAPTTTGAKPVEPTHASSDP